MVSFGTKLDRTYTTYLPFSLKYFMLVKNNVTRRHPSGGIERRKLRRPRRAHMPGARYDISQADRRPCKYGSAVRLLRAKVF